MFEHVLVVCFVDFSLSLPLLFFCNTDLDLNESTCMNKRKRSIVQVLGKVCGQTDRPLFFIIIGNVGRSWPCLVRKM